MWGDKLPILWLHRAVRMGKYLYRENLPPPILTVLISGEATGLLITDQDRDDSLKVHVVLNIKHCNNRAMELLPWPQALALFGAALLTFTCTGECKI